MPPPPPPPDDLQGQKRLLEEARAAAEGGDHRKMLSLLVESKIFDGLTSRLAWADVKWNGNSHPDDIALAIGRATDALYRGQTTGEGVRDVGAFLYKAARNCLVDRIKERRRDGGTLPPGSVPDERPGVLDELVDREEVRIDHDAKRAAAFALVRRLLPQLGQSRAQQVMEIIVDAAERQVVHLPDSAIAEALGIGTGTAKKARQRGFQRLERIVREQGLGEKLLERLRDTNPNDEPE